MAQGNQVFERVEQKYMLDRKQAEKFYELLKNYIKPDAYPNYTLQNLYLDTEDDLLVNRSIAKPYYKEKFRVRTYGHPENGDPVFLEMKKKVGTTVYKRRITSNTREVGHWLDGAQLSNIHGQMGKEFDYAQDMYGLTPKVYIAYDRMAWQGIEDPEIRLTYDYNIRMRDGAYWFDNTKETTPIIDPDKVLLEVKIYRAYPQWLINALQAIGAKRVSFSKYGTAYKLIHA